MENDLLQQLEFNREDKDNVSEALSKSKSSNSQFDVGSLVELIFAHAISDRKHGSNAAKLCSIFIENESTSTGESRFRKVLLTLLQREYTNLKTETNGCRWMAFTRFLSSIFQHVRIRGDPLQALVVPMIECLNALASLACKSSVNQDVVEFLVFQLQFHGEELEKLNELKVAELFCSVRELFLSPSTTQFSRLMLLELIELRASSWTLSASANRYYYGDADDKA